MTQGVKFASIKPRHYSIAEREAKIAESIDVDLDSIDADEAALFLAEAAILIKLDTCFDHVNFSRLSKAGSPLRLRVRGTKPATGRINHVFEILP